MTYDPIAKATLQSTVEEVDQDVCSPACVRMVTQTERNSMRETEPPQPELEDMTPIYLQLLRRANSEVGNQILDELNIPEQLRAIAIEQLCLNDMIGLDGHLTELGRFVSDLELGEPEYGALLWCGHQHNVLSEALTIYTVLSCGTGFVSQKAKTSFPHADGDLHTIDLECLEHCILNSLPD